MDDFGGLWMDCEGCNTSTSIEQCECEQECASFLQPISSYDLKTIKKLKHKFSFLNEDDEVCLLRSAHIDYLRKGLEGLPSACVVVFEYLCACISVRVRHTNMTLTSIASNIYL